MEYLSEVANKEGHSKNEKEVSILILMEYLSEVPFLIPSEPSLVLCFNPYFNGIPFGSFC